MSTAKKRKKRSSLARKPATSRRLSGQTRTSKSWSMTSQHRLFTTRKSRAGGTRLSKRPWSVEISDDVADRVPMTAVQKMVELNVNGGKGHWVTGHDETTGKLMQAFVSTYRHKNGTNVIVIRIEEQRRIIVDLSENFPTLS